MSKQYDIKFEELDSQADDELFWKTYAIWHITDYGQFATALLNFLGYAEEDDFFLGYGRTSWTKWLAQHLQAYKNHSVQRRMNEFTNKRPEIGRISVERYVMHKASFNHPFVRFDKRSKVEKI